ncbi:6-bladed beta-propeller [Parabacteroides bouchesdurhonensis]|uniref:6-bladed beta-propeller n=1 Tax=Parabacteroides bouchesdurhonensis TaxID=1936995 RepID=UPI000C868469|nr:6-bladed beta-propeller [Parabacteroides bouchesdurhonensis]
MKIISSERIVVSLTLLIASLACSYYNENSYEQINIERAFVDTGELSVTDIGDHISYVPLETTDESLIGKRAYVRMLKDKLFVGSFQQPIKMFDKETGKYIRTVGNIGQGANEYTLLDNIPVFWIDETSEIIYVQTEGNSVLRFDVNGNPLGSINLPENFPRLTTVSQITAENKLYIYKQTLFNKLDNKILMYDIQNKNIEKYFLNKDEPISTDEFSQPPLIISGFGNIPVSTRCMIFSLKGNRMFFHYTENPCLWAFGKNIYFKEQFNDTIYQVLDSKMKPRFVFNLGDMHCAYEDRFNIEGSQNKIFIDYILEGKNVLFFVFHINYYNLQNAKTYWGIYNKKDKSVKVTDKLQIKKPANGYFAGELQTATSEGQLLGLVDAASFIENINVDNLHDISEDDNHIVIIVE